MDEIVSPLQHVTPHWRQDLFRLTRGSTECSRFRGSRHGQLTGRESSRGRAPARCGSVTACRNLTPAQRHHVGHEVVGQWTRDRHVDGPLRGVPSGQPFGQGGHHRAAEGVVRPAGPRHGETADHTTGNPTTGSNTAGNRLFPGRTACPGLWACRTPCRHPPGRQAVAGDRFGVRCRGQHHVAQVFQRRPAPWVGHTVEVLLHRVRHRAPSRRTRGAATSRGVRTAHARPGCRAPPAGSRTGHPALVPSGRRR